MTGMFYNSRAFKCTAMFKMHRLAANGMMQIMHLNYALYSHMAAIAGAIHNIFATSDKITFI